MFGTTFYGLSIANNKAVKERTCDVREGMRVEGREWGRRKMRRKCIEINARKNVDNLQKKRLPLLTHSIEYLNKLCIHWIRNCLLKVE